jgi:hypothetical protein
MKRLLEFTPAGLVLAVIGWFLFGLINDIRHECGHRLAAWLLPAGQAMTIRPALAIARAVAVAAPARVLMVREDTREPDRSIPPDWRHVFYPVVSLMPGSAGLEARGARQEILCDLAADERVIKPVRLVMPLTRHAVADQVRNMAVVSYCALRVLLSVALLPLSVLVALGWVTLICALLSMQWAMTPPQDRPDFQPWWGDHIECTENCRRGPAGVARALVAEVLAFDLLFTMLVIGSVCLVVIVFAAPILPFVVNWLLPMPDRPRAQD